MQKTSRLDGLLIFLVSLWILVWFMGGYIFGLSSNSLCFRYLGCNAGFFGYDAFFVHFFGGMMELVFILWFTEKYPKFNLFRKNLWKNIVILIALMALLNIGWEMWEFVCDHIRMNVLHQNLLHPNRLWQASNSDTMGDMFFGLFGATVMIAILGFSDKKYLISSDDNKLKS